MRTVAWKPSGRGKEAHGVPQGGSSDACPGKLSIQAAKSRVHCSVESRTESRLRRQMNAPCAASIWQCGSTRWAVWLLLGLPLPGHTATNKLPQAAAELACKAASPLLVEAP